METLYKCKYNYRMEVKTLWQKRKLLMMRVFSPFCLNVVKIRLLQTLNIAVGDSFVSEQLLYRNRSKGVKNNYFTKTLLTTYRGL